VLRSFWILILHLSSFFCFPFLPFPSSSFSKILSPPYSSLTHTLTHTPTFTHTHMYVCMCTHTLFFWWDWGLDSRVHACKAGTLSLEPQLLSILLWLFWRWGLANFLSQAGLEPWSSWSQSPKWLKLQTWATSTWLNIYLMLAFWLLGSLLDIGDLNDERDHLRP
jgi:hypothetical protein